MKSNTLKEKRNTFSHGKRKKLKDIPHSVLVKFVVHCLKISKYYVFEILACKTILKYSKSIYFGFLY